MDEKTLSILEYPKILERLSRYCAFPASVEKARNLRPTDDIFEARRLLTETLEATQLLVTHSDLSIGGARDVRGPVDLALHGGVLDPNDLLEIKYTLVSARNLARAFERLGAQYPNLADIVAQIPPPLGLIDSVTRAISERGEILDSASVNLEIIRRDLRIVHDRLLAKLQKMVTDPRTATYLQEALITQRDGRYVLPLRAEFKGRIKALIHDQSSSGATLFIEPLSVVEQNNQYRELQLAERDEERRILTDLSHQVGEHAYEISHTVEVLAELDLALAKARYAEDLAATEPNLVPMPRTPVEIQPPAANRQPLVVHNPKSTIRLYEARHPLLDPKTVVPIDVELDEHTFAMVVTGPNTGGKTVTLKTVGLLVLMAQSGLHIPAHSGSEISVFKTIFADIGDEQSIEQSLSTFSSHITNIIRILEQADSQALVILDELGAGTDPTEGAALARSILSHLLERGITTLVTTHHPELKAYAHATPGVVNASVEFDLETLRPTYHLTIGLPGRSNALAIARRLGLPEAIVANARAELSPDDLRAEDLLNEIHHQRDLARQARTAAENARQEADKLRVELFERLETIEDERRNLLEEARAQAGEQLQELQVEISEVRRSLARARQPVEVIRAVEEKVEDLHEQVQLEIERLEPKLSPALQEIEQTRRRAIRLGDKVHLRTLGTQGIVTALSADKGNLEGEAELQVGVLRVRARLADLELSVPSEPPPDTDLPAAVIIREALPGQADFYQASPGLELDLRGKRADDAIDELERYLDAAFVAGLPFVRVIHGKGTGKLREVVRQFLRGHAHVRSFESGGDKEGGDGVTVIKLA